MPTLVEIEIALKQHEGDGKKIAFVFNDDQGNVEFTFVTTIDAIQWAQENFPSIVNNVQRLAPGDADPDPGSPYVPTEFDADKFGRTVTGYTDKTTTDYYSVSDPNSTQAFEVEFPTGTTLVDVYTRINSFGADPSTKPAPTALEILEQKATEYMTFGTQVFTTVSTKVWAVNVLAKSNGQPLTTPQLITLLTTSDTLEKSLKSGSLDTAKYVLGQLVIAFPQYADIGNAAVAQINDYQGTP